MSVVFVWALVLLLLALAGWFHQEYRRIRRLAFVYFPASWIAQSFPLPLAVVAGSTVAVLLVSETARPGATLAALAATALFAAVHVSQRHTGRRLLEDVTQRLGSLDPPSALPTGSGMMPWRVRRDGVECIRDVPYADEQAFGERHHLDIYRSKSPAAAPRPILIQIHGGAWVYGSKEAQALPLLYEMADRGWLCLAINYRLGPKSRFPDMLNDVLRAIAWAQEHAAEYGGDPDFVTLTGGSAGGHLSSLAGLLAGRPDLPPGVSAGERPVAAVVPVYGRYDFLDRAGVWGEARDELIAFKTDNVMPGPPDVARAMWNLASPIDQLHPGAPPMLVVHGKHDTLISIEEARAFDAALRQVGATFEYVELDRTQHAFDVMNSALTQAFVQAVARYLEAQRERLMSSDRVDDRRTA